MDSSSLERHRLDVLAEEFLERQRRGENPTVREYSDDHPDLATEILQLFPLSVELEEARIGCSGNQRGQQSPGEPLGQIGDFRLLREVGRGGMGVVYEAEQLSLGRRVAVKLLPAHFAKNSKYEARFRREAAAAAKLHHTNIVPVFGVGEQDGRLFYAMQFIEGVGLDQLLHELRCRQADSSASSRRGQITMPSPSSTSSTSSTSSPSSNIVDIRRFDSRPPAAPPIDTSHGAASESRTDAENASSENTVAGKLPIGDVPHVAQVAQCHGLLSVGGRREYWKQAATIGLQVAGALAYAHERGILH
ncbi:MAG: protein kinase, partial [Rhodocyclaceae bacterium]|nr:protein kinase [Rhodocyclaceae bacterium]